MASQRSFAWRLAPWLAPIVMVLVGLVFVAASLNDTETPDALDVVAPPNVRDVIEAHAPLWATAQAGAELGGGATSEIIELRTVDAVATTSAVYATRTLIARADRVAPAASTVDESAVAAPPTTITTCVVWDVDVSSGTVVQRAMTDLGREPGEHGLRDPNALAQRCLDVVAPPG